MHKTQVRRINLDLSSLQYEKMTKIMTEKGIKMSQFIRDAVDGHIEKIERQKLEEQLREGYLAKAKLNIETCREFESIDGENAYEGC
ncbi:MAG: CopG family transcriptional regulator [Acidobacteriota bacterium]|nr:CopG family transcriptional regulator [Acidobacteriota bacterium]